MQKTERLVAIALLLQARGKMTAQRLANILGVSTRTVYRDIVALSLAHVPVSMEYGPGGGYYLPEDYHLESAIFTREEAISLILSADMSGNYNLFAGDTDLHRALVKLEAVMPEEYRIDVKAAREHILFDTSAWCNQETPPTYLETIRAAVLQAQQLEILYPCNTDEHCGDDTLQWRRIEPQGLVFKGINRRHVRGGTWYLVAFCQACLQYESFLVRDIEDLHELELPNPPRPQFDLQAYWREVRQRTNAKPDTTVTLTLQVSANARQKFQNEAHPLQENADGSAIIRVKLDSLDAAISYALGSGAEVTVLDPPQVREAVAATALAIAEMYGS